MQLRAEQLHGHLAKSLAPVYAVHGDEPLLALEAADAVRAAARRQGSSERVVFEPGRGFDWSEFTHAAASLSLFAEKNWSSCASPPPSRACKAPRRSPLIAGGPAPTSCSSSRCRGSTAARRTRPGSAPSPKPA